MEEEDEETEKVLIGRASWRSEMHKASTATASATPNLPAHLKTTKIEDALTSASLVEKKTISAWDINDVRSWLRDVSRSIARRWFEAEKTRARQQKKPLDATVTQEILEGCMVGHILSLCDWIEQRMAALEKGGKRGKTRVVTPRVPDIDKISIRWQGKHERGSGGKGGVGNSGRMVNGVKPGENTTRSAGQVLITCTGRKLGEILGDVKAGDAVFGALRLVLDKQKAIKKKSIGDVAAQKRFHQSQRRPWISAKART